MSQFVTGGGGDLDPVAQAVGQASGSELGLLVGDKVTGYLSSFDEKTGKFWFRPPGQKPVSERLRDPSYGAGVDPVKPDEASRGRCAMG